MQKLLDCIVRKLNDTQHNLEYKTKTQYKIHKNNLMDFFFKCQTNMIKRITVHFEYVTFTMFIYKSLLKMLLNIKCSEVISCFPLFLNLNLTSNLMHVHFGGQVLHIKWEQQLAVQYLEEIFNLQKKTDVLDDCQRLRNAITKQ